MNVTYFFVGSYKTVFLHRPNAGDFVLIHNELYLFFALLLIFIACEYKGIFTGCVIIR